MRHKPPLGELVEKTAYAMRDWIGTPNSIIVHTLLFLFSFFLILIGVNIDRVLLTLTTLVSLEAIYLSLFIQMTVNYHGRKLHAVRKGVHDLQENVEDILKDTEELTEDEV